MIHGFRKEAIDESGSILATQFSKIAPHLPTDTRGKPRTGDLRVISGIVHVLGSGGRRVDAPPCADIVVRLKDGRVLAIECKGLEFRREQLQAS